MHNSIDQFYFIVSGVGTTLKYSISSVILGLIIGILLALMKISSNKILKLLANIYTSIFRGTPLMIQISIIYFGLPSLIGIKLTPLLAGIISFSLNSGAYVSEIFRSGINSVDKGQFEAAAALGIPKYLVMKDIIFPQSLGVILPSLINELINLIKESALISIIGEMDLMRRAQVVAMQQYSYFAPMLIAACCYYILVLTVSVLGKFLEKKLAK